MHLCFDLDLDFEYEVLIDEPTHLKVFSAKVYLFFGETGNLSNCNDFTCVLEIEC